MLEPSSREWRSIAGMMILIVSIAMLASCAGNQSLSKPQLYGDGHSDTVAVDTTELVAEQPVAERNPLLYSVDDTQKVSDEKPVSQGSTIQVDQTRSVSNPAEKTSAEKVALSQPKSTEPSVQHEKTDNPLYYGAIDNEDAASAVDDALWRQFNLAEEYHAMGVLANREASWEEAQYYFEKSIKILADLDVEPDTVLTPEAVKYTTLLSNIIADYRITLRSLGELQDDVTPAVMVERFGEVGERLGRDTMQVFSRESQPITYDLPVKINDRVKSSIIYFQTVARDAFRKYLSRSKRYERLFIETLDKYGLPRDLIYLSLVESGYNPAAYSWARAMGLWQFISSTGRSYGLNRNWWIDERKDPVKSTDAASRFLKDLYEQFGDWELAMAAYNGGPGRVRSTIKKQKTIDFWRMKLKRQTMDYVPLIYAATIIAKDPERYGFYDIEHEPEIVWDEVAIDRCLELKVVARELGCKLSELKTLNPELLRNYTPPNTKNYILKVPVGSKQKFLAAYDGMPSPKETSWVKHKISRGQTVSTIAAKYGVSQYAIFEANNLSRRSKIYAGKTIIVPVPLDSKGSSWKREGKADYHSEGSVYTVRSGDTMWDIARAFGTTVNGLRRVNYIERGSRIYVGQRLKIPSSAKKLKQLDQATSSRTYASSGSGGASSKAADATKTGSYKVRSGDTLWDIARKYGTTTAKLRRLNGMGRSSRIYPGQVLAVSGSGGPEYVIHKVKRGETLARIAGKYRTSIAKILAANHLTNPDVIQVGHKLKIYVK